MSELIFDHDKPYYVAVCKHGYGVHQVPAMAIRLAQTEVPARARPSQLLLYEVPYADIGDRIKPVGFKHGEPKWPDGTQVKLVGLTSTHRLFIQSVR